MVSIPPRFLAAVAACCALAALLAPAADAQIDPGEMDDLRQREAELTARLDELSTEIAALDATIGEQQSELARADGRVELIADELERTVDARRQPAMTRVEIAISGFVGGDPRRSALIDEMEAIQGSDEPARRREMYGAVIDGAVVLLAAIDARLGELADSMDDARDDLATIEAELGDTQQQRETAAAEQTTLSAELAEVQARIARLIDLASRAPLTGTTSYDDPTRPALAIKIDNVPAALPQAGINQADIVYVEEVEGGLTRLAAVFHSTGAEVVGPVRSMRTGDLDLLSQLNSPLFATSGGNRGTRGALGATNLVDIGAHVLADGYYRETTRPRPHNLMTNAFNLWALAAGRGGVPERIFAFREPGDPLPPGATPVSNISVAYGSSQVGYSWTGTGWARTQDGRPTVDADEVPVAPTTVVVQATAYGVSGADAASPEAVTVGEGTAFIFTEGHMVQGIWRRPTVDDQTSYVTAAGEPITILPGRTWVELPRPGRTSTS